jgi:glycosyltransferase involved in cell wall biosynthesis
MRCPTLAELPSPPPDKTGWPWTVETPPLPPARPDGSAWPRISIVTPSYNQGQFIEETIRSVLLQGYPDLEYMIIDGGSTDQSVEIIRKYEPWLTYWVSEKDRGQSHAISKGLDNSNGEIFQWINSDDLLLSGTLLSVATAFSGHAVGASILIGYNTLSSILSKNEDLSAESLLSGRTQISQPGLWFPLEKMKIIGLDERLHHAFDWDFVIRYLEMFPHVTEIHSIVVFFRLHVASKTILTQDSFTKERFIIRAKLARSLANPAHRAICQITQRQTNWERHLTEWRRHAPGRKFDVAMRMILLALRNPRLRISRFWLGALRRTIISRP